MSHADCLPVYQLPCEVITFTKITHNKKILPHKMSACAMIMPESIRADCISDEGCGIILITIAARSWHFSRYKADALLFFSTH